MTQFPLPLLLSYIGHNSISANDQERCTDGELKFDFQGSATDYTLIHTGSGSNQQPSYHEDA